MKSFTARITLQFAVLVTATAAVVLIAGRWLQSREAVKGLDFLNEAEFEEVSHRLGPDPRGLSAERVGESLLAHAEIDAAQYLFQVRDSAGELLFRSRNLGAAVLPELGGHAVRRSLDVPGLGRVRATEFVTGDLRVEIASPLDPAERLLRDYARKSLLLLGLVALASVGLGWYFARLTLRPVRAIRETASRIGPETLGERIPLPEGRDELTALAGLLNRMFDRLEASFAQVQRFTADASHELKTPLALLRLNAEKLREKTGADREAAELLDEMLEDLDAVRRMIDSLLFLAKAESGSFAPARAEIAADEFVHSFAEDALAMAEDRGAVFVVERSDAGAVRCEPTLLRQVLLNLVDNALRVTAPGGRITLRSAVSTEAWSLTVSDEGPGVPEAQLERIFERFVRFDRGDDGAGRPRGHGLGLAICRSIAALHGGRISARNRPDRGGLEVTVELPRTAEERR
jgi:signal transduction histidine kinase